MCLNIIQLKLYSIWMCLNVMSHSVEIVQYSDVYENYLVIFRQLLGSSTFERMIFRQFYDFHNFSLFFSYNPV